MSSILVLTGMSIVGVDWYANELLSSKPFNRLNTTRLDARSQTEKAVATLRSGAHKSCIVCDLSDEEFMKVFNRRIGPALKDFARNGGNVSFPTSEGLMLLDDVLKVLFNVPWKTGGYYRTTWGSLPQCAATVDRVFPGMLPRASKMKYSAKACSCKNVSVEDRMFGVTTESTHQSLSMLLSGNGGNVEGADGPSESTDVAVASRSYGSGRITFFGDVNCEAETCALIAAFAGNSGGSNEEESGVSEAGSSRQSESVGQQCAGCGRGEEGDGSVRLKRCGRCRSVRYCSVDCQRADYKQHKPLCLSIANSNA